MAVRVETVPRWYHGRFASWFVTVDHKRIGILYLATSGFFFLAAGVMALLMRTQLAQADMSVVEQDGYNQLFTVHGTTMVFLVVVPILAGFGNFLVPLMIGARDMAFPRLNAMSYWLFLFGGLVLLFSFFADQGAPQAGWTSYPPFSVYTDGPGQDLLILSLHILTVASLAGAINFIVTIHNMRTRGMSWTRLPLFVWSIEVYAALLLLVLPALSAGLTLLLLDRQFDTGFFIPMPERSLLGDLVRRAGGQSIAGATPSPEPFPLERLRRRNPHVYLATSESQVTLDDLRANPATADLRAIRRGRFAVILSELANRPGPRVGRALEQIAAALYPNAFAQDG